MLPKEQIEEWLVFSSFPPKDRVLQPCLCKSGLKTVSFQFSVNSRELLIVKDSYHIATVRLVILILIDLLIEQLFTTIGL